MNIKLISTQRVLSPTQIALADYVINPYRGCEFGCVYCYAQENKNLQNDFFKILGIKVNAPEVLQKELRYTNPRRVLLGSTTESFQYAERKYKITEKIMQILNTHHIPYTILTKSHLITEYLPIISQNPHNKIYFTLNISNEAVILLLENKTPSIYARIETLKRIIEAGISLRLHIGPFIPYLCSLQELLKLLPDGINKINVELYHHKMGNFKELLRRIELYLGSNLKERIATVYSDRELYCKFARKLQEEVRGIERKHNLKAYVIVPDFKAFYNRTIDYHDS